MKIKMPQKFDPDEYKALEEFFFEGKAPPFTALLDYGRPVYRVGTEHIIIPGKKNGPNLEYRIKVGKGDQEKDMGEKIKITGFVRYKGMIEDGYLKYQFDILPDPVVIEDYVRGFVTKRDKIRSLMLSQEIGSNAINLHQYEKSNVKDNTSTKHDDSKTKIPNIPMTLYGTVQDDGGLYIEINAVKVGQNSLVHHNEKFKLGFHQNKQKP